MHAIELPEDYALVLQQVNENGEEDMDTLSEYLRLDRKRLAHIIQALHHKGLIYFSRSRYQSSLIRLSTKGKQLITYVWPEAGMNPGMSPA